MPERPTPSSTPIAQNLGIKPGNCVRVLNGRDGPDLGELPAGARLSPGDATSVDVVLAFVRNRAEVDTTGPRALASVKPAGLLWFAYPKKSAMKTDISRDAGWDSIHSAGWEGVAMVAIDDTWSAMRFRPSADVKNSRFRA